MSLYKRLIQQVPDLVPVDMSAVRTECCGLVAIKGPGGAPLYYLSTDEQMLDAPVETHAIQEEQ